VHALSFRLKPLPLASLGRFLIEISIPGQSLLSGVPSNPSEGMSVTQHARKAAGKETAAKGAARALEEAFAEHQAELLGTLYYLVGNLEDARDALQDAFIKCWRHLETVPEIENLKAWIFRVALNAGRDIRETAWRRKREGLSEGEAALASREEGPEEIAEHDERVARLRDAIKQLRPEEQEVFLLRQNGELTYDQISEVLDVPTGTVKTRMRLALAHLREVLGEE
jgi:RNA polymerase sigma factor (sigma-70 family)